MALDEMQKNKSKVQPAKPKPSPMFLNRNIFQHVHYHLRQIRPSELENTLRFLNFKQSTQLLYYLENSIRNNIDIEISARCSMFILETYQAQIQMTMEMLPIVKSISNNLRLQYKYMRDLIGMNVSALKIIEKDVSSSIAGQLQFSDFNSPFTF